MIAALRSPLFLIIALWLAGLAAGAQFSKIAVTFELVQNHFGQTGVLSGLIISSISLVGLIFGMITGIFAARIGLRRMLILGLALGALMSLYQATLPNLWFMLLSRVIEGFSHLAIVVAIPTLIAQLAGPKWQGAALTFWATFFSVAFAVSALIAPWLITHGGLGSVFAWHGIYMAFFALIFLLLLPRKRQIETPNEKLSLSNLANRHIAAYASPAIMLPGIGWLFYAIVYVATLAVLPPFIAEDQRVLAVTLMPLISLAVSMTIGMFLLSFMPAIKLVQLGFILSLAAALCMFFTSPTLGLSLALYASFGLIQGAGFASVPQVNKTAEDRALSNGGLAQMGNLGTAIGTPILIAMVGALGFDGLPMFLIICFTLALITTGVLALKANHR